MGPVHGPPVHDLLAAQPTCSNCHKPLLMGEAQQMGKGGMAEHVVCPGGGMAALKLLLDDAGEGGVVTVVAVRRALEEVGA